MNHTGNWSLTTVIDIGHSTGNGTSSRNTTEDRSHYIGYTLSDKFGIRVVTVTNHTIGYSSREQ